MNDDGDEVLVRRCCNGDRAAFSALVVRYEKPVYNAALRMLRNREDARDVAQTVFLKAFEHLSDYDPKYRFYSWIYRIALNESINALNRRTRTAPIGSSEVDDAPRPDDVLGSEQAARDVEDALMSLKVEFRSVIVLKHLLECSYGEMSEILGIPEKTVKSRLFSARQQMRDLLLNRSRSAS